ncbi:hypothetical protein Pla123a_42470 [Posidoniimonas polymericola]|uniref:Uncharacterized protein n=2 Tax=Posidoniimonas polymericola TaxID=2528002 RepID=A0A5C5XYS2_9BACT|nr:hypothetical protein Pla123a_42470 [Posidoniimonas polymericola]
MQPDQGPSPISDSEDSVVLGFDLGASEDHEVLALGWAAIDGSADQAAIERLGKLVSSEPQAKRAFESILELDRGLHTLFGAAGAGKAVNLPGDLSVGG